MPVLAIDRKDPIAHQRSEPTPSPRPLLKVIDGRGQDRPDVLRIRREQHPLPEHPELERLPRPGQLLLPPVKECSGFITLDELVDQMQAQVLVGLMERLARHASMVSSKIPSTNGRAQGLEQLLDKEASKRHECYRLKSPHAVCWVRMSLSTLAHSQLPRLEGPEQLLNVWALNGMQVRLLVVDISMWLT